MNTFRVYEILCLFMSMYQSIYSQSVSFTCTAIDSSCKLTATNSNTSFVHIKLTLAVPTSNKWYAISFNNQKKMIGTSVIMVEYSNGAYNPYTGYISSYVPPTKDSTVYLKNFVASTVGSTVNLDFDAPSQITHSNNILLDLNNCYSVAIGTGPIVSGSLSKHTEYPQFSSTCYRLVSPITTTLATTTTTTTTTKPTTTSTTTVTTTAPTTTPTTTKPTSTFTTVTTTAPTTTKAATTVTVTTTRTSSTPTTTTTTATFPMTTTKTSTTTTTPTSKSTIFTFPQFTSVIIPIGGSSIMLINNVVVFSIISIGILMKLIVLS